MVFTLPYLTFNILTPWYLPYLTLPYLPYLNILTPWYLPYLTLPLTYLHHGIYLTLPYL